MRDHDFASCRNQTFQENDAQGGHWIKLADDVAREILCWTDAGTLKLEVDVLQWANHAQDESCSLKLWILYVFILKLKLPVKIEIESKMEYVCDYVIKVVFKFRSIQFISNFGSGIKKKNQYPMVFIIYWTYHFIFCRSNYNKLMQVHGTHGLGIRDLTSYCLSNTDSLIPYNVCPEHLRQRWRSPAEFKNFFRSKIECAYKLSRIETSNIIGGSRGGRQGRAPPPSGEKWKMLSGWNYPLAVLYQDLGLDFWLWRLN